MMRKNLSDWRVADLVSLFVEIGVAQDKALLHDETAAFNRLYARKADILDELKSRGSDGRRSLLPLFDHPNLQVRLNAAKATLAVAPDDARKTLEAIRETGWQPQAGDAGMCLWTLNKGIFKPT